MAHTTATRTTRPTRLSPSRWTSARLALTAALLLLGGGCAVQAPAGPSASGTSEEAALLAEMNRARTARGIPPLAHDPRLAELARAHSHDMATGGYFDHVGPDGRAPADRARDAGYAFRRIAENLYTASGTAADQDFAARAVRAWLESPGHRANMLNPELTHGGVGIVRRDNTALVTALFATPAGR
jgi:uncharacterized protein YkwD